MEYISFYIDVSKKLNIGQVQKGHIFYVFQSVETCGSIVMYESAIESLTLDGSPGTFLSMYSS